MTPDEAVVEVITALGVAGLPYMLVGSLASNFHGIPRSTRDADVVIELPPDGLSRLARALPEDLTLRPQGAFEAVTGTTRYVIDLAGSPFVCELFVLSDDIRNIIAVRHADLDWAYIERWAAAHATAALLAEIRRSIPEGSSPG